MEKAACAEASVVASSGSNASVHAKKSISASASSGAQILVYGAYQEIETEVSGGGKVASP